MNHLILSTDHGPLYLVGRLQVDPGRPALFVMGGIWTPPDHLHELVDWFPGASIVVAPLPGMGGSVTPTFDPRAYARTIEAAIERLFPDTAVVMVGGSAGCLATLGVRSPQVVRHVAVEPFFRTGPLWPLHATARKFIADRPDLTGSAQAAEQLLGVRAGDVVDRDYRWLLDELKAPVDAVVADMPLEPVRPFGELPSLTSVEDRARLAAHPLVTLHQGPPGSDHNVMRTAEGVSLVKGLVRQGLKAAMNRGAVGSA